MTRRYPLPTALGAVLLIGACADAPEFLGPDPATPRLSASPELASFPARETICVFTPGETRVVDGVLHFEGFRAQTIVESEDPRYVGGNSVEFRGFRDLATGDGRGTGRFTLTPKGLAGSWEGTFTGAWTGGLFSGRGVARGTGVLEAQTLHIEYEETVVGLEHTPCPPAVGTQFRQMIRIIDPGPP